MPGPRKPGPELSGGESCWREPRWSAARRAPFARGAPRRKADHRCADRRSAPLIFGGTFQKPRRRAAAGRPPHTPITHTFQEKHDAKAIQGESTDDEPTRAERRRFGRSRSVPPSQEQQIEILAHVPAAALSAREVVSR